MARIDETRPFLPVHIALLTVSDTRTEADDKSGRTLAELPRLLLDVLTRIADGA